MENLKMEIAETDTLAIPDSRLTTEQQYHQPDLAQSVPSAAKNYSITDIFAMQVQILRQIENLGGEITEEIDSALEWVEVNKTDKIDACVYMLDLFKNSAALLKEKEEEFRSARKRHEAVQDRLRLRIKAGMLQVGESVAMGNDYHFTLSTRKDPKITINEEILPLDYFKLIPKAYPDREKIEAALDAGFEIPGAKREPITVLTHSVNTPQKSKKKALK